MNKRTAILGTMVLAVGITVAAGFVYYRTANAEQTAAIVASPTPTDEPAPTASSAPDKKAMLGEVMSASASYLGISAADLKTQLASGKSLADVANATSGKSRDGLVAALSSIADPKVIGKIVDRTVTPH